MIDHTISVKQTSLYGLSDLLRKSVFSVIFALLMAISANAFIYLPFSPVPITLQVLTLIFSALMLGGKWAMASQVIYITMGIAGLPVFAGFSGGPAVLAGPTGGYIAGFILAAYITGSIASNSCLKKIFNGNGCAAALMASISGILVIYVMGGFHLLGFMHNLSPGRQISDIIASVWEMGIRPFIIPDLVKILSAIIILRPGIKKYEDNKNK
jgi:biotin transport system substrate-specific component